MASIRERLRAWRKKRGHAQESGQSKDDAMVVGETHRPSGAIGHGSTVPPGYVPPADEGRPPH
jgi:hypothetical protein